jgi:hypothetical protein
LQGCHPDRHVDTAGHDVHDPVREGQVDLEARVFGHQPDDQGYDESPADAVGRGHAQDPAQALVLFGEGRRRRLLRLQHRLSERQERLAVRCQRDGARGAVDQAHPELVFQRRKAPADRHRRQSRLPPGGREAAGRDDGAEQGHIQEIHQHITD